MGRQLEKLGKHAVSIPTKLTKLGFVGFVSDRSEHFYRTDVADGAVNPFLSDYFLNQDCASHLYKEKVKIQHAHKD